MLKVSAAYLFFPFLKEKRYGEAEILIIEVWHF